MSHLYTLDVVFTYSDESSPAGHDGKVFIATSDGILYALDMNTGAEIWQRQVGDYNQGPSVHSSPAVVGERDGIHGFRRLLFYAFDEETGEILWQYEATTLIRAFPAVANAIVFIPDQDVTLYAFGTPLEPDLTLTSGDIHFSPDQLTEGDVVRMEARVHNIGNRDADSANVLFFDEDPDNGGEQMAIAKEITVGVREFGPVSADWDTKGAGDRETMSHMWQQDNLFPRGKRSQLLGM